MANIRNWKLVFGFFWFFLGFFGFFWHLILWLECHPKKTKKKPKNTKKKPKKTKKTQKNQKKPVATSKLVNWLGFFWFFLVFFGVSTPPIIYVDRILSMYILFLLLQNFMNEFIHYPILSDTTSRLTCIRCGKQRSKISGTRSRRKLVNTESKFCLT